MTDIPDEILENLYLGTITASQNKHVLEKVRGSATQKLLLTMLLEENNTYITHCCWSTSRISQ